MKLKRIKLSLAVVVALLSLLVSHFLAFNLGVKIGTDYGVWRSDIETLAILTSSSEMKLAGEQQKSEDRIHLLMINCAQSIEKRGDNVFAIESGTEKQLRRFAEYYWKRPEIYELERKVWTNDSRALLPKEFVEEQGEMHERMRSILLKRKPAQQVESPNLDSAVAPSK